MQYEEYRHNIQSGDLLAWTHRGWKSWYDLQLQAIRVTTQSEYVHVGIAWVFKGRVFVIESVSPYIRIVPLSNLLPCYLVNTNINWTDGIEEKAMSLVGVGKYSKIEAILSLFKLNKNSKLWECAELVLEIYKAAGLTLNCRAVPSDVVAEAQKIGKFMVYLE